MKTGLLFTEVHEVNMDKYNRITLNIEAEDNKVSIFDAIYVRYKFKDYSSEELRFIKSMKEKFKHSVHICDIDLNNENVMETFNNIREYLGKDVAIFGNISITDEDLITNANNELGLEKLDRFNNNLLSKLDRITLVDNTTKMNLQHIKSIELKMFRSYGVKGLGLCNSPYTNKSNCCISAMFARELAAIFGDEKTAVAVASHENTDGNGCGCVRYQHINYDITILDNTEPNKEEDGDSKSSKEKKEKKEKTHKEKTAPKPKNPPMVDFWI